MLTLDHLDATYHKYIFEEGKKRYKNLIVPPPTQMDIEITTSCSLNCVYCGRLPDSNMNNWKMDKQLIYSLEYELSYVASLIICGGGEAFHNKEIYDILKFIRSINKNCSICIPTNGQVKFTEEDILLFAELDIRIAFSIDNSDYELNELTRPGSNSTKIINDIREINNIKKKHNLNAPLIIIVSVVTKHMIGTAEKNFRCYSDIGCSYFLLQSYRDAGKRYNPGITKTNKKLLDEELYKVYELAEMSPTIRVGGNFMINNSQLISKGKILKQVQNNPCLDPWLYNYIMANGCLLPCTNSKIMYEFGVIDYGKKNIDQVIEQVSDAFEDVITNNEYEVLTEWVRHSHKPFMKIWNGVEMINLRRQIKNNEMNEICSTCTNRNLHNTWYTCT